MRTSGIRCRPRVLTLDYLDREAELRSVAGQREPARAAVKKLGVTWRLVRPRVVAAGGANTARSYDAHVSAMTRLARGAALTTLEREAARGLELVDELERVFG